MQTEDNMEIVRHTPRTCFTPVCFSPFCFKVLCQFTPLLNLRRLIFGLTLFGWFISVYLSIFYYGNIFYLHPLFQEHSWGVKRFTATHNIPPQMAVNKQWHCFWI
jgi:hypothetical protein